MEDVKSQEIEVKSREEFLIEASKMEMGTNLTFICNEPIIKTEGELDTLVFRLQTARRTAEHIGVSYDMRAGHYGKQINVSCHKTPESSLEV